MATFGMYKSFAAKASQDLSARQYHILRFSAAGEVNVASHAAASYLNGPVGVNQTKATSGRAVEVAYEGESKVVAGGSITANVAITTNGSGRATAATSGDIMIGRAMEAASQDGDIIRCLLQNPIPMLRT